MLHHRIRPTCLAFAALVALAGCEAATSSDATTRALRPRGDKPMEQATFAAGCFWGVEAAFRKVEGVASTEVGYSGGKTKNPAYKDVCTNTTGHAECVRVTYDPSALSYEKLLEVFWQCHDPTQRNRQGPDYGTQYRSAIFTHTPEQKAAAEASKKKLEASGGLKRPVATEITPASTFYPAEDYHQQYLEKQGLSHCASGVAK